ncbi:MAG: HEPN domain-containing protein [Planctomycetia bacterium]|nr:HEPN domain-containing protein [Planctomycetia bacterium]
MPPDQHDVLLRKARQDELVLERLLGDSDVDDDTLGFHAQQAAEKLLKAALAARSRNPECDLAAKEISHEELIAGFKGTVVGVLAVAAD